jgi:hypothetical protein
MTSYVSKEAKTLWKKLSSLLAEKWEKPYSVVCGYVNARVSRVLPLSERQTSARATDLCLRGSRIPTSHMSRDRRPQCEDKAGFSLIHRHFS